MSNSAEAILSSKEATAPVAAAELEISNNGLRRDITTRQMLLIAAGGSIGAGLFVGSGQGLPVGGPGSLVLAFAVIGTMVSFTMSALGEMATSYPSLVPLRLFSPLRQSAMGVCHGLELHPQLVDRTAFELTTIVAQVAYWSNVHPAIIIVPLLSSWRPHPSLEAPRCLGNWSTELSSRTRRWPSRLFSALR